MTLSTPEFLEQVNGSDQLTHVQKAETITKMVCFHCGYVMRFNEEDRKAAKASKVFCSLCGVEKSLV